MDLCGPGGLGPGTRTERVTESEISIQGKEEVCNRPGMVCSHTNMFKQGHTSTVQPCQERAKSRGGGA